MFQAGSEGTVGIWHHSVHYTTLGAVCHDNWARLCQLTILGDSWPGRYACGSVFRGGVSGFAIDLLYFVRNSTFGLNGFSYYFMLAWIVLFGLPLCMDMSMLRAARKYVGAYLGA